MVLEKTLESPLDVDVVWGLPRCVWARESTAPAQGNQSLTQPWPGSPKGGLPLTTPGARLRAACPSPPSRCASLWPLLAFKNSLAISKPPPVAFLTAFWISHPLRPGSRLPLSPPLSSRGSAACSPHTQPPSSPSTPGLFFSGKERAAGCPLRRAGLSPLSPGVGQ